MKKGLPLIAIILSSLVLISVFYYVKNWKIKKEYTHLQHIPENATSFTLINVNSLVKNIANQRIWDAENYTKIVDSKYEKEFIDAILSSGLDLNEKAAVFTLEENNSTYFGALIATKNADGFKNKVDDILHKFPKIKEQILVSTQNGTGLILFGNKSSLNTISEGILKNTSELNLELKNETKSIIKYDGHDIVLNNDISETDIVTDFSMVLKEEELENFKRYQNRSGAFAEETEGLVLSAPFFLFKSEKLLEKLAPEFEQAILKHGEFIDLNIIGSQVNIQSEYGCPNIYPLYEMYIQLDNVDGFISDLNIGIPDTIYSEILFTLDKCFKIKGKIEGQKLHLTTFNELSSNYSPNIKPNNIFSLSGELHNTLHTVKGIGGNFAKEKIDEINELENLEGEIKLNHNKTKGQFVSTLRNKGNSLAVILGMVTHPEKYEMVFNLLKAF